MSLRKIRSLTILLNVSALLILFVALIVTHSHFSTLIWFIWVLVSSTISNYEQKRLTIIQKQLWVRADNLHLTAADLSRMTPHQGELDLRMTRTNPPTYFLGMGDLKRITRELDKLEMNSDTDR